MRGIVVVPTRRPNQAQWIRTMHERQRLHVPLLVVLNGAALDARDRYGFADVVLTGPEHKAACLASAEAWCQRNGFDWIAYWDDDDLYCAGYLARVADAFGQGATIVGQTRRYLRTSTGRLWRTLGDCTVMGGCLSALVGVSSWEGIPASNGPEQTWMARTAERPTLMQPGQFCQWRGSEDHTWNVSDRHIALVSGGAVDLGRFDERVVDGSRGEPVGVPVETSEADRWSFVERLKETQ